MTREHRPDDPCPTRTAGHRAALLGVRQRRHPVQGVPTPGTPRTVQEKLADAAQVHRYTGLAPSVALHIPWDLVDDYAALGATPRNWCAARHDQLERVPGRRLQFGSLTHHDARIRQKAIDHHLACIDVMRCHRLQDLKIWLPDGTNYAGQGDIRGARSGSRSRGARSTTGSGRTSGWCWSTRSSSRTSTRWTSGLGDLVRTRLGARGPGAGVPGHGTTRRARTSSSSSPSCCGWGSSARSTSTPATTPTTTSSSGADPFQLFRILFEVVRGGGYGPGSGVAFMLDQCHNIEEKIPGQIRSVLNVQEMTRAPCWWTARRSPPRRRPVTCSARTTS